MTTKTLAINLLAGAFVATSFALALTSASAFGPVVTKDVIVEVDGAASQGVIAKKDQKAAEGYHLQGFRGWDKGYPISNRGCAQIISILPGSCFPSVPAKYAM